MNLENRIDALEKELVALRGRTRVVCSIALVVGVFFVIASCVQLVNAGNKSSRGLKTNIKSNIKSNRPKSNLPKSNLPKSNLPKSNLPKSNF